MSRRFDRFLRHAPLRAPSANLGRVFGVVQETWGLAEDPKTTRPKAERLAGGRTASEAADLARRAAARFAEHGFHKPSGAWWGADETHFHRFVVLAGRYLPRRNSLLIGSGVAALAILTAIGLAGRRRRAESGTQGRETPPRRHPES